MTHSVHRHGIWLYRTFALICLLWLSQVFAVAQAAPVISPASGTYLGSVPLNQPFSVVLTASGGSGGYQGWYECDASDINYDPNAQCMPTGLAINESFGSATTTISGTPTVAGHYDFYVSVYDGNSLLPGVARYTLDVGASSTPTLSGISPNNGSTAGGTSVTLTGTNLTGATAVTIGGTAATSVTVVNATTITATTPAHAAGTVNVTVTTPGGTATLTNAYSYVTPVPTLSSVSPNSGTTAGGTSVTLTGTNLTGATAVTIGGTAATSVTVVNATTITATTPAHASGTVNVTVTTPGGTATLTNAYSYVTPVPTLSSVSPNSGTTAGGTSVTLTGTNLTGATAVTIGGTAATGITVVNATTITATAPAHAAGTANVTVTTPGGTATLTNAYTYVTPTPTLSSVSPNNGTTAGGTSVTLTGTNFSGATGVTFGGVSATGITVVNATTITATTPANVAGAVNVVVTTPGGTATLTNAYTYVTPAPTLSGASPNSGTTAGSTSVTLTGNNLIGTTGVTFGGSAATGVTVNSSTSVTVVTPAHAAGAVDVVLSTPGGTATLVSGYTYIAPSPPVAGAVSVAVAANSSNNSITLNITGGTATSVAVASGPGQGTTNVSGTSITYTPTAGYSGGDSFTYTATGPGGTSAPATVTISVNSPTLVISPSTLPNATASNVYSQTLSTANGATPYSYAVTSGALPPGLSLGSGGVLSGTPSAVGTFNFTVTSTDAHNATGSQAYSLTVAAATITITPTILGTLTTGSAYSQTLSATGGNGSYTWSTSGSLPPGITVSSSGLVSGTPTSIGNYSFTVTVTDSLGSTGSRGYSVTVNDQAPVATSSTLTVQGGSSNNPVALNLTGGSVSQVSIVSNASNGTATATGTTILFTPAAGYSGIDSFTYNATGPGGTSNTATVSVTVTAPTISITPATLTGATQNTAYSQALTASGSSGSYAFSVVSGSLPAGMNLSSAGLLSGTPTAGGNSSFTVRAMSSSGFFGDQAYTLVVTSQAPVAGPLSLTVAANSSANPVTLNLSGGATTSVSVSSGPTHGTTSVSGTTITYTPTAGYSGGDSFTYTASGPGGTSAPATVTISVNAPALVISPSTLPNATASNVYSQTLSTANGATPYSYAVTSGALPPGLSLGSGGVLSGTPSAVGTFNFTVTSTDAHNATGSQAYSLTVAAATITITPTTLGTLTTGSAYSQTLSATGGNGSYTWSTSGSLPPGITVSNSGVVSGTPTSIGNYSFTVTVTDSLGSTGTQGYSVTVNDQAPVATSSTLTVQGGSSNNPVALNLTGGSVSQVSIVSNASNGTATATGTTILFTPAAGYSGIDSFTYNATGPGGTSNTATVNVTVTAPTISITPATLTGATQNTAYSQALTASGSSGSYAFSVVSGSLPAGMNLSSAGLLSGTPTAGGDSSFTVRATSSSGFFGDQAYTLTVTSQAPVASPLSLNVTANSSANPVTLNLSGGATTSVSVSSGPTHGTTSVSGTTITYTPTAGYSGPDSFSYIATGAGGSSSAATVSITVQPPTLAITPATPTLPAASQNTAYSQSLSTSGGTAPYSFAVTSGALPAGLALDAGGNLSGMPTAVVTANFTVTVTDANGATGSRPYSLEVQALPVVVAPSSETVEPGQTATVDLTRGATGGPFTSATLLSVSPPSAGTARMTGAFTMRFAPAAAFSGSAVVSFRLLAASGNSAASFVTFAVQARPDPTKDAEVIGLLNAQSRAAERFASTQMDNFNRRLEQLHRPTCDRNSFNASVRHGRDDVSLGSLGKALRDELEGSGKGGDEDDDEKRRQERDSSRATTGECSEEALAFWTDGFVNTGSNRARGAKDNSFTTYGLSAGMDYRLSPRAVVGVGFGYGNDRADIGEHDTRSEGDALGLAAYLSINPLSEVYIDALLGYNRLSFDSRRYVTAAPSNGYAQGSRDADQLFASLTASYEYRQGPLSLAPYARINSSYTKLDAFSERGGGAYALAYEEQTLRYFTSFVGLRSGYDIDTRFGVLTPRAGLSWGHNFSRNQDYRMRYADQGSDGVLYRLSPDPMDTNFMDLDTGLDLALGRSWRLGFSYKTALGTNERNEMFRIGLDGKF
ncbi:putative Ig domain-containing protein [Pseudomonas putida]|uniref:putative Ig domain-containing protein n=1 Tax=Pseudomonas putida TaxID=303 RepID=UPI0013747671|nr:putative Ig domain-containing protein [Pseudomonas putida]